MSLFRCPVCAAPLERLPGCYRCPAGHSYDCAASGYTYLLPVGQKHSKAPGDDRGMALARRDFLAEGYYAPLQEALCRLIVSLSGDAPALLDAGCGEGYYTAALYESLLAAGKTPTMAGIDISKFILKTAAKREKRIEFAVASSYHLPLADASVDCLLNCFSPLALEEFARVLRPGGYFLYVVPAAEHLLELKEILYAAPHPNEEFSADYAGFTALEELPVAGMLHLRRAADVQNLFRMTPYYWKTPQEGSARLAARETLSTRYAFRILLYRRNA